MTTPTSSTDAAAVIATAQDVARYDQDLYPDTDKIHVNVTRDGERVDAKSYELYLAEPRRPRGDSTVTDVDSFATMLRQSDHQGAFIFADQPHATLTAVVNFESWRDHRVKLTLVLSDQFQRWQLMNGQLLGQEGFAEFIEDNLADITDPAAADMLEMVQNIVATTNMDFQSGFRIDSGSVQFMFVENTEARAGRGGELEVPKTFDIAIPVWRGGPLVPMRASLRYRVNKTGLLLGFKIAQLEEYQRQAFDSAVHDLIDSVDLDELGHVLVNGPAPAAITPLS
ncbi:DUF2303 family protein [Nocardia miyunensis]|uniref:DUF2303 family protein n=1 Tax=Nocardia miyunensis TaxID=282684 RepID=UPI000834ADCB|nr:DUF2303 family protein [Nocardia miyunensis]